jgi:hypothetical protein
VRKAAERQLASYVTTYSERTGQRYAAVLTDGVEWRLYRRLDDGLQQVASLIVDSSAPDVEKLLMWLESLLASRQQIEPTQREIVRKLGADSPRYLFDAAELAAIYAKHSDPPTVKVKRRLWAKLLTTALGIHFIDDDSLFVDHTLLVAMTKLISHSVVLGIRPKILSSMPPQSCPARGSPKPRLAAWSKLTSLTGLSKSPAEIGLSRALRAD